MNSMHFLDPEWIINTLGDWAVLGVVGIIFIETAFILTSFLPGDSLLFVTGLTLATSDSWLPDWLGFLLVWLAGWLGSQVGYLVGKKVGPPLFAKDRGWILNPRVVQRTQSFFDRYGARAVILARFIPILRALVPMAAGIAKMNPRKFFVLNIVGATLWIGLFMTSGYLVGNVPWIKQNLEITVILIILVTSAPIPIELFRLYLDRKRGGKKTQEDLTKANDKQAQ